MQGSIEGEEKPTFRSRTKRKPVEVVVFEDRSKSGRSKKSRKDRPTGSYGKEPSEFKLIFNDVKEFGITGLSKKEKKKLDEAKAQSLGARKPKGQKVPYPILQYAVKVNQQRDSEKQELEKEMGIFSKKPKEKSKNQPKGHGGWWINEDVKIENSSNNMKVKQSDLLKLRKRKV